MLTCFNMIWNCDNFLRRNTKSSKIYTYIFKIDYKNMTYWGNNKYNKQKVSFHNPFYENMFFWQKDPKRDNSPKCKVNTLVRQMLFRPINIPNMV